MMQGRRHRFPFVRAIYPLLRTASVYRPVVTAFGEADYHSLTLVYRGLGYRFYKFERITSQLSTAGRLARERTQRILLPHPSAIRKKGEVHIEENFPLLFPGDLCKIDNLACIIRAIQNDNELYLTLVVEEVNLDDPTQTDL